MTVFADLVSDPSLLPVLETSAEAHRECQKLIDLLDPSAAARDDPSAAEQRRAAISRQQKTVYALLAKLRGLNRDAILRVRETKQATAEARQEIDRLHLQLQNLYYEQRHLMSEIAACESYECVYPSLQVFIHLRLMLCFSHQYRNLPLIPVEEFLELHPHLRDADEHELMIARINHEHAEREKLEQARQELLKRKQALIAENKKRKDDLASLDQDLEKFIDVSLLVVSYNGVSSNRDSRRQNQFKRFSKRNTDFYGVFGSCRRFVC